MTPREAYYKCLNKNKRILELEESGNWIQYNDVRNLIDNHEYLLFELKKSLRDVK